MSALWSALSDKPPGTCLASGFVFFSRRDKLGKHLRSILPETGFITNFSTRKISVGTDGAGSCLASVACYSGRPLGWCWSDS